MAVSTIKEKEYIISNLVSSGEDIKLRYIIFLIKNVSAIQLLLTNIGHFYMHEQKIL